MNIEKCPFCHSENVRHSKLFDAAVCKECGAQGPLRGAVTDKIEAWNQVSKAVDFYNFIMDPRMDDDWPKAVDSYGRVISPEAEDMLKQSIENLNKGVVGGTFEAGDFKELLEEEGDPRD